MGLLSDTCSEVFAVDPYLNKNKGAPSDEKQQEQALGIVVVHDIGGVGSGTG